MQNRSSLTDEYVNVQIEKGMELWQKIEWKHFAKGIDAKLGQNLESI